MGAAERASAGERRTRRIVWVSMIVGLGAAGVAFSYKVAEFIFTISAEEAKGFADVPVTVYFAVAAGWLALLTWCVVTGKFKDLEKAKHEMLAEEEEHERRGA